MKKKFFNNILKKINNKLSYLLFCFRIKTSKLLKRQIINPEAIPIIIINFNQLYYLELLVNFFLERQHQNIIIIDNNSSYPPLLEYYDKIKERVIIERMDQNYGHMVFFENKTLQKKYGQGFYFLTDADIVPNKNLPDNYFHIMLNVLKKDFVNINKVGFALDLESIPAYYPKKYNVLNWEKAFWLNRTNDKEESYFALIDTTFALYKPGYPKKNNQNGFLYAIRMAGDFTAKHGGWYIDYNNLTNEQLFYQKTANSSSSWKINEDGEMNFLAQKHYK